MQTFLEWLVDEGRRDLVPPKILAGYEQGFRQALVQLLGRVKDPVLRAKFRDMLDCPITDSRGRCRSFTDYIMASLIRHGIHRLADLEEVLAYVYQTMMFEKKTTGQPKATVFGSFDANRAYEGNPLEARFKTAVGNAIRNIVGGRIPRLFNSQRPGGTISIGRGRGDMSGTVSPDEIPGRPDHHAALGELVGDLRSMLARKQQAYGLPLVSLFDAMMGGERTAEQRRRFGDRVTTTGRQIIIQTIKDYATSTGNHSLLQLLRRLETPDAPAAVRPPAAVQVPRPIFKSLHDKDYASILNVVDRLGRPVGTADLGRFRRRWLEYPPRDAASGHTNRMGEVLGQMVRDGVLQTVQTGRGAVAYAAGPNAERYRRVAV